MAGLIYMTDVDDLDTAITSKFGQVYSKYGDSVMATLGIDIVQVCPISFLLLGIKNVFPPYCY